MTFKSGDEKFNINTKFKKGEKVYCKCTTPDKSFKKGNFYYIKAIIWLYYFDIVYPTYLIYFKDNFDEFESFVSNERFRYDGVSIVSSVTFSFKIDDYFESVKTMRKRKLYNL